MPTIITHGLVALVIASRLQKQPGIDRRRLLIVCAFCAILPDFDYIGHVMSVQYNTMFGHRGFTHSFFFAALTGLVGAWFLQPKAKGKAKAKSRPKSPDFWKLASLLFAVTATHPILDAMTDGGEGVAFFAPFTNHRYFFPFRPIMVSPLGISAFFESARGLLVLVNEFLLVIVPLSLALYSQEIRKLARAKKALAALFVALWAFALAIFTGLYPLNNLTTVFERGGDPVIQLFEKQHEDQAPLVELQLRAMGGKKVVTNFAELQNRGLFNRRIEAQNIGNHWSSGFFPNWFGGVAGRWQDPNYKLMLRTLFGYGVAGSLQIQDMLREAARNPAKQEFLFKLSPTEKYDLAVGSYSFPTTRAVMAVTHNADDLPHYWYGICNGMAAAARAFAEPFRTVDVINPNGFRIRFHPNDVKALLGYSLGETTLWSKLGARCTINGPEAVNCRINPGLFLLATLNRIGIARDGFVVDAFSGTRKQFYLFDAARVDVLEKPRPVSDFRGWSMPTPVKYLAEVRFNMDFVSTLLGDKDGDVRDESAKDGTYYKKVGRVVVPKSLDALIALNDKGDIVGGAWLGAYDDVPDLIFFPATIPVLKDDSHLKYDPTLNWNILMRLYRESVNPAAARAPVDLSL